MEVVKSEVRPEEARGTGYAGRIFREIRGIIGDTEGQAGALIRVLQQAQGLIGYLPAPVIKTISRDLKIPLSEVYGIISFYHFFSMVPKGISPRVSDLAEVLNPGIHPATLKMRMSRTPHTEVYQRADPTSFQKFSSI